MCAVCCGRPRVRRSPGLSWTAPPTRLPVDVSTVSALAAVSVNDTSGPPITRSRGLGSPLLFFLSYVTTNPLAGSGASSLEVYPESTHSSPPPAHSPVQGATLLTWVIAASAHLAWPLCCIHCTSVVFVHIAAGALCFTITRLPRSLS